MIMHSCREYKRRIFKVGDHYFKKYLFENELFERYVGKLERS